MIKHKHHIIPKHIGGSDDPSNLIELTIEEHAEAHRKLFEEHGRWRDKLAWKSLSGQISGAEIARLKRIEVNRARRGKGVGETNAMFLAENRKKVAQSKLGKKLYYNPQTKQKMFFYPNNVLENFFPIRKS
jgi:hypothetical protein